jgi:hypothetical protein
MEKTNFNLKELLELQRKLDLTIVKNELGKEEIGENEIYKHRTYNQLQNAIFDEFSELQNSLKWKWWKKYTIQETTNIENNFEKIKPLLNQTLIKKYPNLKQLYKHIYTNLVLDVDNIVVELVDILHFILSTINKNLDELKEISYENYLLHSYGLGLIDDIDDILRELKINDKKAKKEFINSSNFLRNRFYDFKFITYGKAKVLTDKIEELEKNENNELTGSVLTKIFWKEFNLYRILLLDFYNMLEIENANVITHGKINDEIIDKIIEQLAYIREIIEKYLYIVSVLFGISFDVIVNKYKQKNILNLLRQDKELGEYGKNYPKEIEITEKLIKELKEIFDVDLERLKKEKIEDNELINYLVNYYNDRYSTYGDFKELFKKIKETKEDKGLNL